MYNESEENIIKDWTEGDIVSPLVSVSIVTYNHENYIEECLDSILSQKTNFAFEIVIGEDCSSDNTKLIIQKYEKNYPNIIKPIYNKVNVMAQQNLINVLAKCRGKYISHLDGDDCMLANKLQMQLEFFKEHDECAIVFHNMKFIGDTIIDDKFNNHLNENEMIIDIDEFVDIGLAHWCNSSKMYKKSAYPQEGIQAFDCIGDQHYHLQNARNGKIGYIPQVLGLYRKHSSGQSSINKQLGRIKCALKDLVKTYNDAYSFGVKKKIVDKRLAFHYYDSGIQFLMLKDFNSFSDCMNKSYENKIFYNKKHELLYKLKDKPLVAYYLKLFNNYLNKLQGKQTI